KLMAKQAGVKNVTFEADVLTLEMTEGMNFNRIKQEGYFRDGVNIGKTQLKLDIQRLGESWRRLLEKLLQGCG
ncbi:MAG: hypothetical protein IZT57_01890, partial [Chloroflexi bacterium]|nr:hypothetical protein [Chloroflexota bacterium]